MERDDIIGRLAKNLDGKVHEVGILPDGSGLATISYALPPDHWLTREGINVPPMPFRIGKFRPHRREWEEKIREAAKFAVRASTMNGKETDFDPDAMVQNMILGMLGYHTDDALCGDEWGNPDPIPSEIEARDDGGI